MFATVRHWWGSGRGRVTLRLFLFELFVVILGVLIAQSVANWVAARAERAEGEVLRESGQKAVRGLGQVLNYWALRAPCLRDRVDSIARIAASGGQLSARQIGRPALPIVPQFSLSEADWHKLELVASPDEFQLFQSVALVGEQVQASNQDIANRWPVFRLLDPATGGASGEDRSQVRLAAVTIENRLRFNQFQRDFFAERFKQFDLKAAGLPKSNALVDGCGLLRSWR